VSEINVVSRTQTIVVEPVSTSVSVIHTGQPGRDGVGAALTGHLMAKLRVSPSPPTLTMGAETLVPYDLISGNGWSVLGSVITCSLAGRYHVSALVNLRQIATTTAGVMNLRLRQKRGSTTILEVESPDNAYMSNAAGDESGSAFPAHGVFDFQAGDVLEVGVYTGVTVYFNVFGGYGRSILTITPIGAIDPDTSDSDWSIVTTQTIDASPKTSFILPVPLNSILMIESHTVARRSGGTAGTAGDGAMYVRHALANNPAGTANFIGSVSATVTQESVAGYNVAWGFGTPVSSIFFSVTGVLDTIIDWKTWYRTRKLP
jgi:hypothetical protein